MNKTVFFFPLLLTLPVLATAQSGDVQSSTYRLMLKTLLSHTVPEINVQDAYDVRRKAVFLDTREPAEYGVSRIKGARLVGYDNFDIQSVRDLPKQQPLIVYCSVGYRSEKVSEKLLADGFTNVRNMYGGIFEWKTQGLPVVDNTGKATNRVHAFSRTWGVWLKNAEKVY